MRWYCNSLRHSVCVHVQSASLEASQQCHASYKVWSFLIFYESSKHLSTSGWSCTAHKAHRALFMAQGKSKIFENQWVDPHSSWAVLTSRLRICCLPCFRSESCRCRESDLHRGRGFQSDPDRAEQTWLSRRMVAHKVTVATYLSCTWGASSPVPEEEGETSEHSLNFPGPQSTTTTSLPLYLGIKALIL